MSQRAINHTLCGCVGVVREPTFGGPTRPEALGGGLGRGEQLGLEAFEDQANRG
jgi:hypothetical protein